MAHPDLLEFAFRDTAIDVEKPHHQKSPNALRTISEAAEMLDVPQHVLRFWETKFSQVKPLKRNGGRRFYRPADIEVLQQIKTLLYRQGYTIKGAKKAIDEALTKRGHETRDWVNQFVPANVNDNASPEVAAVEADIPLDVTPKAAPQVLVMPHLYARLRTMRDELASLRAEITPFLAVA
jgi:DNA-binding transcriptional MerR regulator